MEKVFRSGRKAITLINYWIQLSGKTTRPLFLGKHIITKKAARYGDTGYHTLTKYNKTGIDRRIAAVKEIAEGITGGRHSIHVYWICINIMVERCGMPYTKGWWKSLGRIPLVAPLSLGAVVNFFKHKKQKIVAVLFYWKWQLLLLMKDTTQTNCFHIVYQHRRR